MEHEMLDCKAVMRQLWDYLDGELTPDRIEAVAAHLSVCERCFPQYEFQRAFLTAIAAAQQTRPTPAGLRERVLSALMQAGLRHAS